jgi:peptidoglycan/xylan/chitin deacetylase (PgdA/CDA1 family)
MLGRASAAVAAAELGTSRTRLRDLGAGSVDYFAYPNGSFGVTARRAAAGAGYAAAFAVGQAAAGTSADPFALPRFDVGARAAEEVLLEITGAFQRARTVRRAVRR